MKYILIALLMLNMACTNITPTDVYYAPVDMSCVEDIILDDDGYYIEYNNPDQFDIEGILGIPIDSSLVEQFTIDYANNSRSNWSIKIYEFTWPNGDIGTSMEIIHQPFIDTLMD